MKPKHFSGSIVGRRILSEDLVRMPLDKLSRLAFREDPGGDRSQLGILRTVRYAALFGASQSAIDREPRDWQSC